MAGLHLLKGLIREGDPFPNRVEELAADLAEHLREPSRRINYSPSGLARVERAVRRTSMRAIWAAGRADDAL
jgi:hypothetical protein